MKQNKSTYFENLKSCILDATQKKSALTQIVSLVHRKSLEHPFKRWREQAQLPKMIQTQKENGPKARLLRKQEQVLQNLFTIASKKCGFTLKDIFTTVSKGEERVERLQLQSLYQINSHSMQDDNYLKPRVLQRWKIWVKYRKAMRYWLKYCENFINCQQTSDKEDKFKAFQKWKNYFQHREDKFNTRPLREIQNYSIITNKVVAETKEQVDEKFDAITELSNQNMALVDNTISGQKLSLSIMSDNYKAATKSCFQTWV